MDSVGVVGSALLVDLVSDLVRLSVAVQVLNALLLPLVLGLLVALAVKALPPRQRLRGAYLWVVLAVVVLTSGLGVYGGLAKLWH